MVAEAVVNTAPDCGAIPKLWGLSAKHKDSVPSFLSNLFQCYFQTKFKLLVSSKGFPSSCKLWLRIVLQNNPGFFFFSFRRILQITCQKYRVYLFPQGMNCQITNSHRFSLLRQKWEATALSCVAAVPLGTCGSNCSCASQTLMLPISAKIEQSELGSLHSAGTIRDAALFASSNDDA